MRVSNQSKQNWSCLEHGDTNFVNLTDFSALVIDSLFLLSFNQTHKHKSVLFPFLKTQGKDKDAYVQASF